MRPSPLLPALVLAACGCASVAGNRCTVPADAIVVDTAERELWLCSDGRVVGRFDVALGRGGTGKRREGDGRTPLGTYALAEPRPSRYGTFIPIAYPTTRQRASGFTGSNVGIHGPAPSNAWLGGVSTWADWTAGCVATGTREEVAEIARFVRARRPRIVIR